jgi:hypothetical protein
MAAALQTAFAGLTLRAQSSALRRQPAFTSNGTAQKLAMKSKLTFQVEVGPPKCLSRAECSRPIAAGCARGRSCIALNLPGCTLLRREPRAPPFLRSPRGMPLTAAFVCLQVVVGNDEPQDGAMKRFRREVMSTGLVQEVRRCPPPPCRPRRAPAAHHPPAPARGPPCAPQVRRRRYFENSVELKKRKDRECRIKTKRNRQYPPKTWDQVVPPETSPFNDMFGTPEDIFADVLVSRRGMRVLGLLQAGKRRGLVGGLVAAGMVWGAWPVYESPDSYSYRMAFVLRLCRTARTGTTARRGASTTTSATAAAATGPGTDALKAQGASAREYLFDSKLRRSPGICYARLSNTCSEQHTLPGGRQGAKGKTQISHQPPARLCGPFLITPTFVWQHSRRRDAQGP